MTDSKKVKKTDSDEEKIAKARKKRLAIAKDQKSEVVEKTNDREDFRKYFLKISKSLNLKKYLEEVIWTHLKTINCDKKELFDKGLKHFGYNI